MNIQEVRGADGRYRCSVCGQITRYALHYPVFDGRGGTRLLTGRAVCRCQEAEEAREKEQERFRADMDAIRALKKLSLMDARLRDASFSNYTIKPENAEAHRAAVRYVEKFGDLLHTGQGLIFCGPVGTGKSYTAAAIANELMNRKRSAVMTSFVKLLETLSSYRTDTADYIDRLNHADLLFIDDLGAERSTDTALEKVYDIIDSRYRSCKPLILTTNLEMRQLRDETDIRYVRIYDRVIEMCYPVRMNGLSWRRREAADRFRNMRQLLEG